MMDDVYHVKVESFRSMVFLEELFPAGHFESETISVSTHWFVNRYNFSPLLLSDPL